ncbi:MAG: HNH endonuclease, partial [Chloroflexi bacterium]|nr:HNH endonuclease [Chloroflexota bacterium]
GYITVAPDGVVEVSDQLDAPARAILTLGSPRRISRIVPAHRPYLAWHREHVFRR